MVEHEPALKSFTIARRDGEDETESASALARHLGSDHRVIDLGEVDPAAIGARIPWMFDQPFYNDATIANYVLARAIAGDLTVAITGDGGDNTFSGTMRHLGDGVAAAVGRAPRALALMAAGAVELGARITTQPPILRRARHAFRVAELDDRRRWLALHEQNLPIRHRDLLAGPRWAAANGHDPAAAAMSYYDRCASTDHLDRVLYAELRFQVPPNDVMKVDRSFMYNGVAGRSPFLDRRVVEFAASLPVAWKRRGRTYKWFLRELASRRLPASAAVGRKIGLAVPLREWLRGPLGVKVASVLGSASFAERGIFDPRGAAQAVRDHRAGRADYGHAIWTMAMTELFFRTFVDSFGEPDERIWE
jgi:asparagine synthase (glutamine-hydrolysing)